MAMFVPIELLTLAEGRAVELFDEGIRKVCLDVDDKGAKPDAPRSFSLIFKLEPILDTGTAKLTVTRSAIKGAPSIPAVTGVHLDSTSGQTVLKEAHQIPMPDNVLKHTGEKDV